MNFPWICSAEELAALVEEAGFLPFFQNEIEGFSIEEHTPPELWWGGEQWGPWDWKGPVIQSARCAYGKFYRGKAMYISSKFFPDFCNLRRNGYDYDARMDEGLVRRSDMAVMQALSETPLLISRDLKARTCFSKESRAAFDGIMTHLQMTGYVNIADFSYPLDRKGKPYGWGLAVYTTPEAFFGEQFRERVYQRSPEGSAKVLTDHLEKLLPKASLSQIARIVGEPS